MYLSYIYLLYFHIHIYIYNFWIWPLFVLCFGTESSCVLPIAIFKFMTILPSQLLRFPLFDSISWSLSEWAFKSFHDTSEMNSKGRAPPLFTGRMFRESCLLPQGHILIYMGGRENNNAYFIGSLGGFSCQIGIICQLKIRKRIIFFM